MRPLPCASTLLLLATACRSVQPTYADLEQKVFLQSCATASCHSTQGNAGGLDLSQGKGFSQLVGVAAVNDAAKAEGLLRVTAGDPAKSFLLTKVRPGTLSSKYGEHMPPLGDPLDDDAVSALEEWIQQGAKAE